MTEATANDESVLFDYQVKWVSDSYPYKVIEKGRQIGITFATAAWAALEAALSKQDGGKSCYYVGYNKVMATEFITDVAYWAEIFDLAVRDVGGRQQVYEKDKQEHSTFIYKVQFASGNEVIALSSRPENIRSRHGHLIIDEAAFHKDLPALIKAGLALTTWGGKVLVISTHNGDINPFNRLCHEIRIGQEDARLFTATFSRAVAEGLYERIASREGLPRDAEARDRWVKAQYRRYRDNADEELEAIPSRGSSAYIPVQIIERTMVRDRPLLRLSLPNEFMLRAEWERTEEIEMWCRAQLLPLLAKLPNHARHYLGMDFGRSVDKTAIAPLTECDNLDYDCPFIVELHNVPFECQWVVISAMLKGMPKLDHACIEAKGNGHQLAERAASRYHHVELVHTSERYYVEHMPAFRTAFEEARLRIPSHTDILQDLRSIDVVRGVPKIPENKRRNGTDGLSRHGDTAMALFFAWCATGMKSPAPAGGRIDVPVDAYRIVPPRRRHLTRR